MNISDQPSNNQLSTRLLSENDPRQRTERNPAFLYIQSLGSPASKQTVTGLIARFVRHWNHIAPQPFLPEMLAAFSTKDISGANRESVKDSNRNLKTALAAPWHQLTNGVLLLVMRTIENELSGPEKEEAAASTYNSYLSAIKGVSKKALLAGVIPEDEYNLIVDNGARKVSDLPSGRAVQIDEVQDIVDQCLMEGSKAGLRDALLFLLLFGCGPRRAEISGMDLKDVDLRQGIIRVKGKGNKTRELILQPYTLEVLKEWIDEAEIQKGALFRRISKSDNPAQYIEERTASIQTRPVRSIDNPAVAPKRIADQTSKQPPSPRLTAHGVYNIVKRRMLMFSAESGALTTTPHDFRRGLITFLHKQGVDPITIADMVGHADINTTKRYISSLDEQKQKAASLVQFHADPRRN